MTHVWQVAYCSLYHIYISLDVLAHDTLVDRPTQLICISDIYLLYVNRQIQKT